MEKVSIRSSLPEVDKNRKKSGRTRSGRSGAVGKSEKAKTDEKSCKNGRCVESG